MTIYQKKFSAFVFTTEVGQEVFFPRGVVGIKYDKRQWGRPFVAGEKYIHPFVFDDNTIDPGRDCPESFLSPYEAVDYVISHLQNQKHISDDIPVFCLEEIARQKAQSLVGKYLSA
jgi:hypothetical protein